MATHSSTLAEKIPWTEEPGAGYCPWGRKKSDMTERLHFLSKLHPLKSLDIFQRSSCSHAQGDMSTKVYCNFINIRKKSEQKCPIGKWMVTCGVSITELRFGCQEFKRQCWQRGKVLESEKLPILGGELMSRDQLQGFCSVMTVFKGKILGGRISVNHRGRRVGSVFSTECRLADSLQVLPCLNDLPAGLLKGLLGGREFIIF